MGRAYRFTFGQMAAFVTEYFGVTLDAAGEEDLQCLLESEAERGHLTAEGDEGDTNNPAEET